MQAPLANELVVGEAVASWVAWLQNSERPVAKTAAEWLISGSQQEVRTSGPRGTPNVIA